MLLFSTSGSGWMMLSAHEMKPPVPGSFYSPCVVHVLFTAYCIHPTETLNMEIFIFSWFFSYTAHHCNYLSTL